MALSFRVLILIFFFFFLSLNSVAVILNVNEKMGHLSQGSSF